MATNTTNLELKKPAYSDTADISDINGNMDIIDTAVNAVENGMAIIANGNTHAAITSGQYVYIRKHGSLSEGLYKATQTIATNGTLSSSNVTAVSGGALNTLNEQIATKVTDVKSQISCDWANLEQAVRLETGNIIEYQFGFIPLTNAGIEMTRKTVVCPGCPTSAHVIISACGNMTTMGGGYTAGLTIPGFFAPWANGVTIDLGYAYGNPDVFVDSSHLKYFQLNVLMLKIS